MTSRSDFQNLINIGVIQKPSGHKFAHFWPPTYLRGHFLCTKHGQKVQIFYHPPTSHCPRGFWMTPYTTWLWDIKVCSVSKIECFHLGVIQKPCGHNFTHFWPPTYLCGHFLCTKHGQKLQIFDHPPTSHCPHGFWMTPKQAWQKWNLVGIVGITTTFSIRVKVLNLLAMFGYEVCSMATDCQSITIARWAAHGHKIKWCHGL